MTKDQKILIIGASRGIGAAVALEYARRGAHVVAAARDMNALAAIVDKANGLGGTIDVLQCDAAVPEQVRDTIRNALALLGRVDVGIYNAGVGSPEWMSDFTAQRTAAVFAVNTHGLAVAMEALFPLLREQGGGVFAGVSSLADVRGYPGSAAYCASKAAASTLLESARIELRPLGIHVLTIRPGFVRTAMTAKNEFHMPFLLEPDRAARIIVRGIERRKTLIQFPWQIALATRLIRILPNFIFDFLARRSREQRA